MKSAASLIKKGDILYGRLRPYLNKVALANIEAAASAEFIIIKCLPVVENKYLQYAMHSKRFVHFSMQDTSGDRPRVDFNKISRFVIPVAPVSEQRRIVARIDELFAEIAEGEAALKSARQGLDLWRRSLLKAAVTGELTRDWREAHKPTETGADLLARIRAERQAAGTKIGRGRRSAAPAPLDTSSLPELPEGWVWARLSELGETTGGLTKNPNREKFPKQIPFLRVANVQMGRLDLTEIKKIGIADGEASRVALEKGDLLIVEGNGSIGQIGRCAIWNEEISPCAHQNHIIKIRFINSLLSRWVLTWLISPNGRKYIEEVASSTSGLHTLSISKIGSPRILVVNFEGFSQRRQA